MIHPFQGGLLHQCPDEALNWQKNLPEEIDIANGALVDDINRDQPIVKKARDHVWMLEVNGNEYRGPIRFCPWCGENLK
jgi:hypothetical protein